MSASPKLVDLAATGAVLYRLAREAKVSPYQARRAVLRIASFSTGDRKFLRALFGLEESDFDELLAGVAGSGSDGLPDFESCPDTAPDPSSKVALGAAILIAAVDLAQRYDGERPSLDRIRAQEAEVLDCALAYGRQVRGGSR